MNLQPFKYVIALSKYKSFSKAAVYCNVSQPAISKAISELESKFRCSLYEYKNKQIELTPSGIIVLDYAKRILRNYEDLECKIKLVHEVLPKVRIGYIILGYLQHFQRNHLHNKNLSAYIETVYDSAINLKQKLLTDEVDAILIPYVCGLDLDDCNLIHLSIQKLHILTHQSHPLYKKDSVMFSELCETLFIGWDQEDLPQVNSHYRQAFVNLGVEPKFVAYGKKMGDILSLMLSHNACGLATPIVSNFQEEYKFIEVSDSELIHGLALCWKKSNSNQTLNELIQQL